jgi:hypothetical protein
MDPASSREQIKSLDGPSFSRIKSSIASLIDECNYSKRKWRGPTDADLALDIEAARFEHLPRILAQDNPERATQSR